MKPEPHIPAASVPTDQYNREHPLLANPGETHLMAHLPQLDGVRALAVLMVMWHHFAPLNPGPLGAVGVGLFFVLSGFLITRILLNCKLKIDDGKSTVGTMLKQFYMRRFLRIFPLYYGTIAVLCLFNVTGIRDRVWWHLSYLSNILFSITEYPRGTIPQPMERHFWSLAVEEQFYMFWPFVILFTPRKWIKWVIAGTIIVGPAWRMIVQANEVGMGLHKKSLLDQWATPGCLDMLAFGGILALMSLPRYGLTRYWKALVETSGVIGIPLLFIYISLAGAGALPWMADQTPYLPTALAGVCLVGIAAKGFVGPVGYLLQSKPLVYTGRISYGLYVLHMFVPHLLDVLLLRMGFEQGLRGLSQSTAWLFTSNESTMLSLRPWMVGLYATVATFLLATISWYVYEAPINGLKRYFEYDGAKRAVIK